MPMLPVVPHAPAPAQLPASGPAPTAAPGAEGAAAAGFSGLLALLLGGNPVPRSGGVPGLLPAAEEGAEAAADGSILPALPLAPALPLPGTGGAVRGAEGSLPVPRGGPGGTLLAGDASAVALDTLVREALGREAQSRLERGPATEALSGVAGELLTTRGMPRGEAAPTPMPPMQTPVGEAAWGRELGERLVWMASQGAQRAELRLNPPQLGPLEIQLSLKRDEASVSFVSHHGAVRDAVEAALPRLRELLGAQGFDLVQVDVSAGGGEREGASQARGGPGGGGTAASGDAAEEGTGATPAPLLGGHGLVDTFA